MSDEKCPNCNHGPHSGLCGRSDGFTPSGCRCVYDPAQTVSKGGPDTPLKCPDCGSPSPGANFCLVPDHPHPYCDHDWCRNKFHRKAVPSSAEGVGTGEPKIEMGIDLGFGTSKGVYRCSECGISEEPCKHAGIPEGERMSARETERVATRILLALYAHATVHSKEGAYADIVNILTAASSLRGTGERELEQLRAWKESAITVWPDMQKIAKLIGVKLGDSVHDKIIPWIEAAESREAKLREQVAAEQEAHEQIGTLLLPLVGTGDGTSVDAAGKAADEIAKLRDCLEELIEGYEEAISAHPAEFVTLEHSLRFEVSVERAKKVLKP